MNYFKKNISYLRGKKSMKLREISKEIGFSSSQWNNYELGYSFPKFLDLIKISKYFDISETNLIHTDLELNEIVALSENENQDEIILLQKKIIKIQDDKIILLEKELANKKN